MMNAYTSMNPAELADERQAMLTDWAFFVRLEAWAWDNNFGRALVKAQQHLAIIEHHWAQFEQAVQMFDGPFTDLLIDLGLA